MKKKMSYLFLSCMTCSTLFLSDLAYSQSEPGLDLITVAENCTCTDSKGKVHNYAYRTNCLDGGSQPCTPTDCPPPPSGCD